jgi:hypothetical protein
MHSHELLAACRLLATHLELTGADVVEVSPLTNLTNITALAGARIAHEIITGIASRAYERPPPRRSSRANRQTSGLISARPLSGSIALRSSTGGSSMISSRGADGGVEKMPAEHGGFERPTPGRAALSVQAASPAWPPGPLLTRSWAEGVSPARAGRGDVAPTRAAPR